VFEKFDLAKALLGLFERLAGATEILAFAREYLIALLNSYDHVCPRPQKTFPCPQTP
jgi:hypothetical protein